MKLVSSVSLELYLPKMRKQSGYSTVATGTPPMEMMLLLSPGRSATVVHLNGAGINPFLRFTKPHLSYDSWAKQIPGSRLSQ